MTVVLPFSPLPGADKSNSLAEAVQANLDALATVVPDGLAQGQIGVFLPVVMAAGVTGSGSFTPLWPCECYSIYTGTGYATAVGLAYVNFSFDGALQTSLPFYFNETGAHRSPGFGVAFTSNVSPVAHTVAVAAGAALSRDVNDVSSVAVIARRTG